MDEPEQAACPLCGASSVRMVKEVPYTTIWAALQREWSATFSLDVRRANSPRTVSRLVECDRCGLQYFAPPAAGDPAFYRELMAQVSYEPWRWEFDIVSALLGRNDSVLDLGCGDGAFLRQLAPRRGELVGVDSNPGARHRADPPGMEFFHGSVAAFAASRTEEFDAVCAFQVIEHVASVRSLIEPAVARLRIGGRLFVSVPNRRRSRAGDFDALDHPPHHVSRWHPDQLRRLSWVSDLELVSLRCQRLHPRIHRALRPVVVVAHRLLPSHALRSSLAQIVQSRGRTGHTMLAEYRRRG